MVGIQSLVAPQTLDISGTPVLQAKVTSVGIGVAGSGAELRVRLRDPESLLDLGKRLFWSWFSLQNCPLCHARIGLKIRDIGDKRSRTLHIVLKG